MWELAASERLHQALTHGGGGQTSPPDSAISISRTLTPACGPSEHLGSATSSTTQEAWILEGISDFWPQQEIKAICALTF